MFCRKCGTGNADNAQFCVNCGAPLRQPQTPDGKESVSPQPAGKKHRALPWIIAGAVLAAALAVILILVLGKGTAGGDREETGAETEYGGLSDAAGFSAPEEAALAFMEGTGDGDFGRAVSAVHPLMAESLNREEFEERKKSGETQETVRGKISVEEIRPADEDAAETEKEIRDSFHEDLRVEQVCYVSLSCPAEVQDREDVIRIRLRLFCTGGKWYVFPSRSGLGAARKGLSGTGRQNGGFSTPEEAALAYYEGGLAGNRERSVSAVHPGMMKDYPEKDFEDACRWMEDENISLSDFTVQNINYQETECGDAMDFLLEEYGLDVSVTNVCYLSIFCKVNHGEKTDDMGDDLVVIELEGRWYIVPEM